MNALRNATELAELSIQSIIWAQDNSQAVHAANFDIISLPYLETLKIAVTEEYINPNVPQGPGAHQLLRQLRAPELTEPTLTDLQSDGDLLAASDFVTASGLPPRITVLHIGGPSGGRVSAGLISLLAHLPLLEHLGIWSATKTPPAMFNVDDLLVALRWTPTGTDCTGSQSSTAELGMKVMTRPKTVSSKNLCPRLEGVLFYHVIMNSDLLKNLVESRVPAQSDADAWD
ncbi:hypothetical protein BDV98DRAFT_221274 [Pterulicium gracile]|uniref:Uncharacterized protein n=1 Tax=Pterulicium gracile TaxID=1884261 RepID=A0A5C3Q7S3_9AGAR|nr:hypothetical protein BDV98DRAFT_221274 [Pterula gracilis]